MGYIVDISEWQAPAKIDYDQFAKQLDLAIIRVQYGSSYIDKHYKTHLQELQKREVPCAVYAWVRGVSITDMEAEATDFYQRAKAYSPKFWFLDIEEQSMPDMRSGCEAYRAKLKSFGAGKVGVYLANHLYQPFNLDTSRFDARWIPHYGNNNGQINSKPDFACDLHQYTSRGKLAGYAEELDLNCLTGTKPLSFFTNNQTNQRGDDEEVKWTDFTQALPLHALGIAYVTVNCQAFDQPALYGKPIQNLAQGSAWQYYNQVGNFISIAPNCWLKLTDCVLKQNMGKVTGRYVGLTVKFKHDGVAHQQPDFSAKNGKTFKRGETYQVWQQASDQAQNLWFNLGGDNWINERDLDIVL